MIKPKFRLRGFTIVELLVVIVVIGILAAITIVSYSGIRQRANLATLQSDLKNASTQLEIARTENDAYPDQSSANLKSSPGTTLTYTRSTTTSYCLEGENNGVTYHINSTDKKVTAGECPMSCADLPGFIPVPGDSTYGTSDFCVMAYEAKADSTGDGVGDTTQTTGHNTWPAGTNPISNSIKLVSTPQGYPVANISQTTAIAAAQNYTRTSTGTNCTGCHVISEAQWMTIVKNVLSNPNNWSSGVVGTGYTYSGHNDHDPSIALTVTDTNEPYNGTNDIEDDSSTTNGMIGDTQRRRLQLTNGEYIWDLAGNVWEWTDYSQTGGFPTGMPSSNWYEWTAITGIGSIPSIQDPRPSSTGLTGSASWSATNGIGRIYGNSSAVLLHSFLRGGGWIYDVIAGVLALRLDGSPSDLDYDYGFRVSRD